MATQGFFLQDPPPGTLVALEEGVKVFRLFCIVKINKSIMEWVHQQPGYWRHHGHDHVLAYMMDSGAICGGRTKSIKDLIKNFTIVGNLGENAGRPCFRVGKDITIPQYSPRLRKNREQLTVTRHCHVFFRDGQVYDCVINT